MTTAEFVEVTGELEKAFGDKEYNEMQRKYLYDELKRISKERYRQVIRKAIHTMKLMPKVADLIEIENNLPKDNARVKEKVECNICGGTGLVIYTKLMEDGSRRLEYKYAARCSCANANGISNLIPLASQIGI